MINYEAVTAEVMRYEEWARTTASKWKSLEERRKEARNLVFDTEKRNKKKGRGYVVDWDERKHKVTSEMGKWPIGLMQ